MFNFCTLQVDKWRLEVLRQWVARLEGRETVTREELAGFLCAVRGVEVHPGAWSRAMGPVDGHCGSQVQAWLGPGEVAGGGRPLALEVKEEIQRWKGWDGVHKLFE